MKKVCFLFLVISLVVCSGCGTTNKNVVLLEQPFLMETVNFGDDPFIITINYLYQGKKPQIEFVDVKETGLGDFTSTCEDITTEAYNGKYRGYRLGTVCVEFTYEQKEQIKPITVEELTLSVNGTEETLIFKEPLKMIPISERANSGMISLVQLSVGSGVGGEVTFAFEAIEDVTLERFDLGKYAELEDVVLGLDAESKGEAKKIGGEECLPLTVNKGDSFVIQGTVESEYFTGYQDIDAMSTLHYSVNGEEHIEQHNLFLGAICEMEDVKFCIDQLFEKNIIQ